MHHKHLLILFVFSLGAPDFISAAPQVIGTEPPAAGNFLVPFYKQLRPFISLGQNVLTKEDITLFFSSPTYLQQTHGHQTQLTQSLLYSLTPDLSFAFAMPVAVDFKDRQQHSSGLQDLDAQFEYAVISEETAHWTQKASIVVDVSPPTGSPSKRPPTGYGTPSTLVGATYNHTYSLWAASKAGVVQLAIGLPVKQQSFGTKKKDKYLLGALFGIVI